MAFLEGLFTLIGRILLAAIFLGAAVNKIKDPQGTQAYMKNVGKMDQLYPQDERTVMYLMWGAVGLLVVGGISVLFGYKARFGAFCLIVFLASATYFFHPFWKFEGTDQFQVQMTNFLKNCAVGGGLFIVLARGAGRWSLDGPPRTYDEF
jgi:putative oxidoreductase